MKLKTDVSQRKATPCNDKDPQEKNWPTSQKLPPVNVE